jgi:uncharacterized membrane protein
MNQNFINNSIYGIDSIFYRFRLEETVGVNGYPLLAVVFNLTMLAVPYFIFILLKKHKNKTGLKNIKDKAIALALGFLWLIFIPNVVYIISDIRHINGFCPVDSEFRICVDTAWMILFFFLYASIGWVAFVYFLNQMKGFIGGIFNPPAPFSKRGDYGNFFIISVIPLISLGILLGLFNRWNSWEIFVDPIGIIKTAVLYFTDLTYFLNWLVFTIFLYILYYGGNYFFRANKL